MPFFVYRIVGERDLTQLGVFDKYQEAKKLVRERRANADDIDVADYRMMHAKSPLEAETLLTAPRDNRVIGED